MGHRKTIVAGLLAVCGLAGLVSFEIRAATATTDKNKKEIQWQTDLIEAHKISAKDKRPLLIVFSAEWCTYCKKLEKETFLERQMIEYVNTKFVPVRLDFDEQRKIADILEVKSLPTSVILSADADLLGTVVGYVKKDEYRKSLAAALEFEQTIRD